MHAYINERMLPQYQNNNILTQQLIPNGSGNHTPVTSITGACMCCCRKLLTTIILNSLKLSKRTTT